ncbi:hypothetical protein AMTR_s00086p00099100 [Amborella trichopoda]|uniref:NB-ARC domain-containing protein n=1 Tax=Amborella trichopoda TaxID=13333 RepID=W1P570_AMBTC|nr:hypothetical protein AMTR_s00086p00099100 [Amborella trichopoda]
MAKFEGELPSGISNINIKSLIYLNVSNSIIIRWRNEFPRGLRVPYGIGNLANLRMKHLCTFTHPNHSPKGVSRCVALRCVFSVSLCVGFIPLQISRRPICCPRKVARVSVQDWKSGGEVEEGSMPCLQTLHIGACNKLKGLHQGLHCLTALQSFSLYETTPVSMKRLDRLEGEDRSKVQHIPLIQRYFKIQGEWYYEAM